MHYVKCALCETCALCEVCTEFVACSVHLVKCALFFDFKVAAILQGFFILEKTMKWCDFLCTGKDPITNLQDHLANPWVNNFTTNGAQRLQPTYSDENHKVFRGNSFR